LMKFGTLAGTVPCNKYQLLGTTGQHKVVSLDGKIIHQKMWDGVT